MRDQIEIWDFNKGSRSRKEFPVIPPFDQRWVFG